MEQIKNKKSGNPLYGLILAGGKSTRMKTDKSILRYHGQTQVEHAVHLLEKYCDKVFVSNRKEQTELQGHNVAPQIHDRDEFSNIGPVGGILSAMTSAPEASWLIMACDLPFVDEKILQTLIDQRDPNKMATGYISAHDQLPEPLCAIWEAGSYSKVLGFVKQGTYCPRKILINSDAKLIPLPAKNALDNINSPDEYKEALKFLK